MRWRRWNVIGLVGVAIAVAVAVWVATRAPGPMVAELTAQRREEIVAVATQIAADLDDLHDNLEFVAHLVSIAGSPEERRREVSAILAVVKQYQAFSVYDGQGTLLEAVSAPGTDPAVADALAAAAREALTREPGALYVSKFVAPSYWRRAVATALPDHAGVIAVLVDTNVYFTKLKLLKSSETHVLLLGPKGHLLPDTDPSLVASLKRVGISSLVDSMRTGIAGARVLPASVAQSIGLGNADAIAAWAPIEMVGGERWVVGTLSSGVSLRARERAFMWKLVILFGAGLVALLGIGALASAAARRRVALRERLRHAEHRSQIVDHLPAGVVVLSETGEVTAVNEVLRARTGAIVGGGLAAVFPGASPDVLATLSALVAEARAAGAVKNLVDVELALFGADGRYVVNAIPLAPRFADARALLVVEDVTEVHSLSSQLLRAEKLATVGILAAGIAHEIGTPLGIVRVRAEILTDRLGSTHEQTPGARVILEQIDRITRTLRQLLDFARPQQQAPAAAVGVEPVARAVVELLGYEAERRGIRLQLDVVDDVPDLSADPDQLQQVLINLVLNAFDACTARGTVTIRAQRDKDHCVRIDVVDTGVGIPPELRHQVFDPFFTTKKRGQGTGLGLAIVLQIVRNHNARIDIESHLGQGTCVSLWWPALGEHDKAA